MSRAGWSDDTFTERTLIDGNIHYEVSMDANRNKTIIPNCVYIGDRNRLNKTLAEFYNHQILYDKSGFSDFLARAYAGAIKNAN